MKKFFLNFLLLLIAIVLMNGCKTGEYKDQILTMTILQARMANERDSLMSLLASKVSQFEKTQEDLNTTAAGKMEAEQMNKTLKASLNRRMEQLKQESARNESLTGAVADKTAMNDSLQKEIIALQKHIAAIDSKIAEAENSSRTMEQSLLAEKQKRIADSIAMANKPVPLPPKEGGYINITEIGGGMGLGNTDPDFSKSFFALNNVNGLVINKHFMAGVGVGLNFYNGGFMVPLYLDMRYMFNEKDFSPFIAADGGLLIYPSEIQSSGLFINPRFGLIKRLSIKSSIHISTGFYVQEAPSGMRNSFINLNGGFSFSPGRGNR